MPQPPVDRLIDRQSWMEGVADKLQSWIGAIFKALGAPGAALKSALHGTRVFGHPLHPAVTDVPLGAWTVAIIADYASVISSRVPTEVGNVALGIGWLAALLAVATGYTDFHETFGRERRYAVSHGLLMTIAFVLYTISLAIRLWGAGGGRGAAIGFATVGYVIVLSAAWLGGHLVFGIGTMVNRSAFIDTGPDDFMRVGASEDFREGELSAVEANGMRVLMVRVGGRLCALSDTCAHAGGPLHEGALEGDIVICPWHASRFRVTDGRVRGGPATFSQPALVVREQAGVVEVKLENPLH